MLNLFAGEQADTLDLEALVELHRTEGLWLRGERAAVRGCGKPVMILDDGEPSARAAVTTLLRLAAVGAYALSRSRDLTHHTHVMAVAEQRDRALAALLEREPTDA